MNPHTLMFLTFSAVAASFAIAVAATSNVVRMAFYLTISLGAVAGLFFLAGAQFVGAMQLMIYVGGTLVLLVFGVMLTAHAKFIDMKTASGEWVIAAVLGASLFVLLAWAGLSVEKWRTPRDRSDPIAIQETETATAQGAALVGIRLDRLNQTEGARSGKSGYLLPFVVVSMHLLVVLVGAGYMARTKRKAERRVTGAVK